MKIQNEFHGAIQAFINGALFSKKDQFLGLLRARIPIKTHAVFMLENYAELVSGGGGDVIINHVVRVEPYQGDVVEVWKTSEALASIEKHILLACVHGSLGSYETVCYSDFDALVILRDSAFKNAATLIKVAGVLTACQRNMYDFDPLQHHGWFVLTEYDLNHYCDAYFPAVLFKHSKSIIGRLPVDMTVRTRLSSEEQISAAKSLIQSVFDTEINKTKTDLYSLKSFLSKIMLIPAMYLQAITGYGVFKKDSFALITEHFSSNDLEPIKVASRIRANWEQNINPLKKRLYSTVGVRRKLIKRIVPVMVQSDILSQLDDHFETSLRRLLRNMQLKLSSVSHDSHARTLEG